MIGQPQGHRGRAGLVLFYPSAPSKADVSPIVQISAARHGKLYAPVYFSLRVRDGIADVSVQSEQNGHPSVDGERLTSAPVALIGGQEDFFCAGNVDKLR